MILRPYKFLVVAVVQQVEDDEVVGEQQIAAQGQPVEVFGVEALKRWADNFLASLTEEQLGRTNES